ncbi:copper resistance CopC family protein [Pseudonocardia yunnanensis]|uniref:Copper resistance protein CopC n=1 Tax=Pseudonocardia yunnanensis TaxID=58107 RepID=A0ABW4F1Y9_9PSEU
MSTAAPDFIGTRRRPRGVLLGLLVALLWLVLPAPAASAHAYLLASTPPDGYAVPTSPTALSLDFDQSVTIGAAPLKLTDTAGGPHSVGPAMLSLGGRRLAAPVPARLPNGGYRIRGGVAGRGRSPLGTVRRPGPCAGGLIGTRHSINALRKTRTSGRSLAPLRRVGRTGRHPDELRLRNACGPALRRFHSANLELVRLVQE